MRENVSELESEIKTEIFPVEIVDMKYEPRRVASFTLVLKHGIGNRNIKKLQELCEKENLHYYIVSKRFTEKLIVYLSERDDDAKKD